MGTTPVAVLVLVYLRSLGQLLKRFCLCFKVLRVTFLESHDKYRARKAVVVYIEDKGFNSSAYNMIRLSVNKTKWAGCCRAGTRAFYFVDFDLSI